MANSNPKTENLIHLSDRTPEERAAIASMGGKARQEQIRRRKSLREELEILMQEGDRQKRISTALVDAAEAGNVSAFNSIRDTLGEKPKTEVSADIGGRWFESVSEMTEEQKEIARRFFMKREGEEENPLHIMVRDSLSVNARRELLEELLTPPEEWQQ